MFKVVPDQLRVSDGWVRCGQCDEVFDANAHLQTLEKAPAPVKQPDPNPFAWGDSLEVDGAAPQPKIELEFPAALGSIPLDGDVLDEVPTASDPMDAVPADDLGVSIPAIEETMLLQHSELDSTSQVHSELHSDLQSDMPLDAAPAPTPYFLKPERSTFQPHSRGARAVVAVFCVLSACILLVQWLVYDHDRIAATEPATLVFLEPLCGVLDCRIAPLRQIESVVIDSSSFGKMQADVYRLGFVIKSTALVDVAVPSLELTLTDAQDLAVVRRVLSLQDLGSQRSTLSSGGEWAGSVPVTVKLPSGSERIAGYRLLAFYP